MISLERGTTMSHQRNTATASAPIIEALAIKFPGVFVADKTQPHKPLALGIRQQIRIACPELGRRKVANAMFFFVGRLRYREALVEGAARIDLNGKPVGKVTKDEAEHAAERVKADLARRASKQSSLSDLKLAASMRKKRR
jgi:sRNA-binding protein